MPEVSMVWTSPRAMNVAISVLLRRKGDEVFSVAPEVSVLAAVAEMKAHLRGAA